MKTPFNREKGQIVIDGFMITCSGKLINLFEVSINDVLLGDIAHGLANNCRWNGATKSFYSVAEHSIRVSERLPSELKLFGLLHDSEEAYWGDIIKPLKIYLPNIIIQKMINLRHLIYTHFIERNLPLTDIELNLIKEADKEELLWEYDNMIYNNIHAGYSPNIAKKKWLQKYHELTN